MANALMSNDSTLDDDFSDKLVDAAMEAIQDLCGDEGGTSAFDPAIVVELAMTKVARACELERWADITSGALIEQARRQVEGVETFTVEKAADLAIERLSAIYGPPADREAARVAVLGYFDSAHSNSRDAD